jgi:hypothetical protein
MKALLVMVVATVSLVIAGCNAEQPKAPAAPQYTTTATIKDIMDSIVDPNADILWGAVSTTFTAKGVIQKAPHTDEEWEDLRHHAIELVEATNLLLIPNRQVAKPGQKADNPDVELGPEDIQKTIDGDRTAWASHVQALHDTALISLKAIEAKDASALSDNGDKMDTYCEGCHVVYWYPKDKYSKELYQDSLKRVQGETAPK